MSKWQRVSWADTLEQARELSARLGQNPTEIESGPEGSDLQYFKIPSADYIVAQKTGGPVMQREHKPPAYNPVRDDKRAGPWMRSQFRTLEEARQYFENLPSQDNIEVVEALLVFNKTDEHLFYIRLGSRGDRERLMSRIIYEPSTNAK